MDNREQQAGSCISFGEAQGGETAGDRLTSRLPKSTAKEALARSRRFWIAQGSIVENTGGREESQAARCRIARYYEGR